jgi:hypothetical protein
MYLDRQKAYPFPGIHKAALHKQQPMKDILMISW